MQSVPTRFYNLFVKVVSLTVVLGILVLLLSAVFSYTRAGGDARVYAAASSNLNFQARLYTASGGLVPDGNGYSIQFKIYDAVTGGTEKWSETQATTRVVNGYLTVNLGSVTAFPGTIDWSQEHWLTMNVNGDGEMSPRLKLTAVPYAFQSKQAEILKKVQGSNTGVLDFSTLTTTRALYLPDKDGTLCVNGSSDCVDVTTTNTTATTSSNSGLEISNDGLRLLGGCSDAQMLRWNATTKLWECASESVSSIGVNETDGSPTTSATTIEFGPPTNSSDEFIVTDQGSGVTRIRLGSTVLTTNNYGSTLDGIYVNTAESPLAGDISGSFSAGLSVNSVQNNSVNLGTDTVGNYVANFGTLTGLSTSGNTGEGSTPGLSVLYGSGANNAAAGANTFTCSSGTGNLTGGGTVVTIGTTGTTCAAITTNAAVSFGTSVTTPLLTSSGLLSISSTVTAGADDIVFSNAGSESLRILENGDLKFERGTNDAFFSIAAPSGSPATYTFSGATGTVLTTANFAAGGGLDAAYVNVGESPAAGDITGSFSAGLNIGADAVALGTDTTGNYVASLGTLVGLSTSGNSGEGSTPGLTVLYGSGANNAAAGANTFTCTSGSGNLSGGGTVVTIGTSGTTCGAISTNNAVTFSTSVTSPTFTGTGAVTLSSGGSSGLTLDSASNTISIAANDTTLQRIAAGTYTIDLSDASATTLRLTNSGAGVANLDIFKGGLSTAGTTRLTNGGALQNITGLTITSGGASITGALNLNNGGITNTGSIAGATTVNASGLITSVGLTAGSGLIQGTGGLTITGTTNINASGATAVNIGNASTPLTITSTGLKATSAGAVSGVTTLALSGAITGATSTNTINGLIINSGALSGITNLTMSGALTVSPGGSIIANGNTGSDIAACTAGQYIGNGVRVDDGIITAGSCRNDASGISDERVKKDITSVSSVLDKLGDLNVVTFNFKVEEMPELNLDHGLQYGVIAQQLQQIFPELVSQRADGYNEVNFQGLSMYNLKAVSEIAKHIDSAGNASLNNATVANSLKVNGVLEAGTIRADRIEGLDYLGRIDSIEARVSTLEQQPGTASGNQQSINLENLVVGQLTANKPATFNDTAVFEKATTLNGGATINGQTDVQALTVNLGLVAKGSLEVNGPATFKEVVRFEKNTQFDGQINVLGYANVQGLTVNLDLIVRGAMLVEGPTTFKEAVRFEKDVTFEGNVAVKGQATFSSDTAGTSILPAGKTVVKVEFTKPHAEIPIITLTLGDGKFAPYSYRNVTKEGFEIVVQLPATEPLNFSWIALQAQPKDPPKEVSRGSLP